jgi:hypothetical protein
MNVVNMELFKSEQCLQVHMCGYMFIDFQCLSKPFIYCQCFFTMNHIKTKMN